MPNRIIKDSINESRGLTSCSFFAQDLYKRLITYADDYGRFNADPQIMIARLYPRELSVVSVEDLMDALVELVGVDKIRFYTAKPRKEVYGCFPNWSEHQRLRDSKKKLPDPEDVTVNDLYLRRFIPIRMKAEIIKRDGFKCCECGKHIAESTDPYRIAKMATGCFHIDHIVPCGQGGRATLENLRLLCPKCNQSRKKCFSFDEIVAFATDSPQTAASSGELPLESNPIQSNTESRIQNPNTNSPARARHKYGQYDNVLLSDDELEKLKSEFSDWAERIEAVSEYVAKTGKGYKNYLAAIRSWARKDAEKSRTEKKNDRASMQDEWLKKHIAADSGAMTPSKLARERGISYEEAEKLLKGEAG